MPLRISLEWLREHLELPERPEAIADALTLAGTEVERIIEVGGGWSDLVVVARVDQLERVEGSDGLQVAQLEVGDRRVQVATKAPNIALGQVVPLALPGAELAGGFVIKERKMMGRASQGMICSPMELGLSSEADGIMVLGSDMATGMPLSELMPPDHVFVVEVTPNRPDELSHLGIARELSAVLNRPLRDRTPKVAESRSSNTIEVDVRDGDLCRRYVARVMDVTVGPSPQWIQRRLRAVGQRPINNVVDAANYVLMEVGQPLHTFDADRLTGRIIVRRAVEGEKIACLDGRERELAAGMLVIADEAGPQAIAGIIGGADSAVSPQTRRVVIESATFLGMSVRSTSRRLGLRTEASSRFEKQLAPDLAPLGAARLAELLQQVAGGGPASTAVDAYPRPFGTRPIRCHRDAFTEKLGDQVKPDQVEDYLRRLQFKVERKSEEFIVTPPSYRLDVQIPEDLVEEVGRLRGYNTLPSTLPGRRRAVDRILAALDPEWEGRDIAAANGFDEVINISFASRSDPAPAGVFPGSRLHLAYPMVADQDAMRTSLLPGLARAAQRNLAVGNVDLRIFELGRVFWPKAGQELPDEARVLGVAAHVDAPAGERGRGATRAALLEVKAFFADLVRSMSGLALTEEQTVVPGLHPGRALVLRLDGRDAGCLGELHPDFAASLDLPGRLVVGELNFDMLAAREHVARFQSLPRFPAVLRDLAVSVPARTPARDVIDAIRSHGGAILRSVELFDEYQGAQLESDRKGLAFRLTFQSDERTLTGDEVASAHQAILQSLRSLDAVERS